MEVSLPKHIAIIMDGNRRWAKKRFLPKNAGHKAGATALENLVLEAEKIGLKYLTVYAFSTENWNREAEEVSGLMKLLHNYLDKYIDEAKNKNISLRVIGNKDALDKDLQEKIKKTQKTTEGKTGLALNIAISYGGRNEILRASKKLINQAIKTGINIEDIDENYFERHLDTYGIPDPELLIRTSGETRLSNFLLWQLAYTEIYFTDTLWPDFTIKHLLTAVDFYNKRTKNLGR
ncbi:MAG: isoprenyl transferase [Defluviitaleaceae bacterium]|nr:isoprenyl transferase [Defluviitaleaceae bacterium]